MLRYELFRVRPEMFWVIPSHSEAPCGQCNRPLRYWILVHCILSCWIGSGCSDAIVKPRVVICCYLDVSGLVLCLFCLDFWLFGQGGAILGANLDAFNLSDPWSHRCPRNGPGGILQLLQAPVRLVFFLRLCHVQSLNNNIQECVRQLTHSMAWRTSKARQRGNASMTGPVSYMNGGDCQLTMHNIYIYIMYIYIMYIIYNILNYIILYYITLYYIILHYIILYYTILYYIMLYYIILYLSYMYIYMCVWYAFIYYTELLSI